MVDEAEPLVNTLAGLWDLEASFSDLAFGPPSYRGPVGPLRHLEREAREAQAKPDDIEEHADCLLLIIDAARRAGFSPHVLLAAAVAKVRKNAARTWPDWRAQPGDVVLEHARDAPQA